LRSNGSPETIVSDEAGDFRGDRATAVYEALKIENEHIELGQPWQSFIQAAFSIWNGIADYHFAKAEG
jgi:hypothetical protein